MNADRIGFIGLGQMGGPMARRLAGWPGGLVVYDVRPQASEPLSEAGAQVAASPRAVGEAAGLVSVMVRDDDQVRDVVGALTDAAPHGTIVAIHSTISAATATRLAQRAQPFGIEVVDAPVSGGFMGASNGSLAVMVGGSPEAYRRCREPFGAWASLVLHMGPVGAGTRAKLARNLLHFVAFAAAGEAQRLAEASGIDLRKLAKVVRHSDTVTGGPGAIMLRDTAAALDPGDPLYEILCHVRALGEKDLSLALELGADSGVKLPLAHLALERLATALGVPHQEDAK
ncbi:MAG: NAD(P)-dependent oxidoreductase [Micromonosporaceae bacterium]